MCVFVPGSHLASEEKAPGDQWREWSEELRVGYANGWMEGELSVLYRECEQRPSGEWDACLRRLERSLRIPHDYQIGQFEDGITHFYSDFRNRLIPMSLLAEEVEKEIYGARDSEIEADLESLRKAAQHHSER
jgi:hypothetical protein